MYTINETISTLGFDRETVKFPIVMTLDPAMSKYEQYFNISSVDDPVVVDRFLLDMGMKIITNYL